MTNGKVYILIKEDLDGIMSVLCHWHEYPTPDEIVDMVELIPSSNKGSIFYIATADAHHTH